MDKRWIQFLLIVGVLSAFSAFVYAATGPAAPTTATVVSSSNLNESGKGSTSIQAVAGNLTKLTITTVSETQSWGGLYGNVTGTITLDDAQNLTLFSWADLEPRGVIYAVNQTVADWTTAHCFNITAPRPNNISYNYTYDGGTKFTNTTVFLTLRELEDAYHINATNVDGVDETFNTTNTHPGFFVGDTEILVSDCATASMNQYDAIQSSNFQEVLLTVNDTEVVIFAQVIENLASGNNTDKIGFNNEAWDFEMLVIEDGKNGDIATDEYFIYVEIQ